MIYGAIWLGYLGDIEAKLDCKNEWVWVVLGWVSGGKAGGFLRGILKEYEMDVNISKDEKGVEKRS